MKQFKQTDRGKKVATTRKRNMVDALHLKIVYFFFLLWQKRRKGAEQSNLPFGLFASLCVCVFRQRCEKDIFNTASKIKKEKKIANEWWEKQCVLFYFIFFCFQWEMRKKGTKQNWIVENERLFRLKTNIANEYKWENAFIKEWKTISAISFTRRQKQ